MTSMVAHRLMQLERPNDAALANDAMLAGVVMDIGHFDSAAESTRRLSAAVELCLSRRHSDLGTRGDELPRHTRSTWGVPCRLVGRMPDAIVEAVAYHHTPCSCTQQRFNVLTAVHVADALVQEVNPLSNWPFGAVLDESYLKTLGVDHRIAV